MVKYYFLEQNLEELMMDVYGAEKFQNMKNSIMEVEKQFEFIESNPDKYIHIDGYIVGTENGPVKEIRCSGIGEVDKLDRNLFPLNKLGFEQYSKLKIHCHPLHTLEFTPRLKNALITAILNAGKMIPI